MHLRAGNKLIITSILALIIYAGFLNAGQAGRSFTNEDLEQYGDSSISSAEHIETTKTQDKEESLKTTERPLKKYTVPYSGNSRRIIIPVTFNGRVTAKMLLDTGAPGMHISGALAEKLGLLDSRESNLWVIVGGIGGSVPAIFTIMDSIRVGEAEDNFIPTFISRSVSSEFEGLIGMDFMANYQVRIDTKNQVVIFEELPESKEMPAGHNEQWWRTTFDQFKSLRLAWEKYRDSFSRQEAFTQREKDLKAFIDRQYRKVNELNDRLSGYASQHSVPLEWR
jgi:hypothetical protein